MFVFTLFLCGLVTGKFSFICEASPEYNRDHVQLSVLLKLLPFVEWTEKEAETANLAIGVWDNDEFSGILEALIEGLESERTIEVVDVNENNLEARVIDLDILYFSSVSDWKKWASAITRSNPRLMVVGSGDAFLDEGGILNFISKGERVAFEVNNRRAREAGIVFRSRLLRLAERVVQ